MLSSYYVQLANPEANVYDGWNTQPHTFWYVIAHTEQDAIRQAKLMAGYTEGEAATPRRVRDCMLLSRLEE